MEKFQQHPSIDEIVVVCLEGWEDMLKAYAKQFKISKLRRVFKGGETGMKSIQNAVFGLREELNDDDIILVQDGIRVNAVAPGFVRTAMTDALAPEVKEKALENAALKRFAEAEDIAKAVLFLASEDASYITGHILSVNGGLYM